MFGTHCDRYITSALGPNCRGYVPEKRISKKSRICFKNEEYATAFIVAAVIGKIDVRQRVEARDVTNP